MFNDFPDEIKAYAQWVCWKYETTDSGKQTKIPYNIRTGFRSSSTDPSTWTTFENAVSACPQYDGVGFVLSENDPYTFIDLDNPGDPTQQKVAEHFKSYSEHSPSGNGLHIIVRGSVPNGLKKDKLEIYSEDRFMTVTGKPYNNLPVADYTQDILQLWYWLGGKTKQKQAAIETQEQTDEDQKVIDAASKAVNGYAFTQLHNGNWNLEYPSQSEADLAYLNMLAYYTDSKEQVKRIFLNSEMGSRDKARRDSYTDNMIWKAFDQKIPMVDINSFLTANAPNFSQNHIELRPAKKEDAKHKLTPIKGNVFTNPPGIIGELAQFLYDAAPRPVHEIALAGAIALMSGICGRAYNVSNMGLNQYVLLLAPTGRGKESMSSGIDKLINAVSWQVEDANKFVGPSEIASGQALIKYLSKESNSFVSIAGEFGIRLQQLSNPRASSAELTLRRVLLDLYNKTGQGTMMRSSVYADASKNIEGIESPNFTMLAESTPSTFYQVVDEGLVTDGLMPRFLIMEYNGTRPPFNKDHSQIQVPEKLQTSLAGLAANAIQLNKKNRVINVLPDDGAEQLLDEIDQHADDVINTSDNEVTQNLWTRAHVKVMKLAALVAVGNNPYHPTMTEGDVNWAYKIVKHDIYNIMERFKTGNLGSLTDEGNQVHIIRKEIKNMHKMSEKANIKEKQLLEKGIIPMSYFQRVLGPRSAFKKDRLGAKVAMKKALEYLVDSGELMEVHRQQLKDNFGYTGKGFGVVGS